MYIAINCKTAILNMSEEYPKVTKLRQIGTGTFATVYKVEKNGQLYALKQIDLEQSPDELQYC